MIPKRKYLIVGLVGALQVPAAMIATIGAYQAVVPPVLSEFTRAERLGYAAWVFALVPPFILVGLAYRWIDPIGPWRRALIALGLSVVVIGILTLCLYFGAYFIGNFDIVIPGWVVLVAVGAAIHIHVARRPPRPSFPSPLADPQSTAF